MKNLKMKLLAIVGSTLVAGSAMAGTDTTINFTANLVPGCVFSQTSFTATFPNIPAGTVGETQGDISIFCSTDVAFTVTPSVDSATFSGLEDVVVTAYTDAARTTPFTSVAPLASTGNSTFTRTLYFRANGVGKTDFGKGSILTEMQSFNVQFPLTLSF